MLSPPWTGLAVLAAALQLDEPCGLIYGVIAVPFCFFQEQVVIGMNIYMKWQVEFCFSALLLCWYLVGMKVSSDMTSGPLIALSKIFHSSQ